MDSEWHHRLKEARIKKGYTLRELESFGKLGISQQSLIKYERGEVYPRIDLLEKMCSLYETTLDYVLYGDDEFKKYDNKESSLIVLFFLLYSGKISYDPKTTTITIDDKILSKQLKALNSFNENVDFSSIEDLFVLISGIKKLSDDC